MIEPRHTSITGALFALWFLLFCLLTSTLSGQSSSLDGVVRWSFELVNAEHPQLRAKAEIAEGWAVYSQFLEEGGPIPTLLKLELPSSAQLIGPCAESGDQQSGYDSLFEMNVLKFSREMILQQAFQPGEGQNQISGTLRFMACDASRCLPPKTMAFQLPLP